MVGGGNLSNHDGRLLHDRKPVQGLQTGSQISGYAAQRTAMRRLQPLYFARWMWTRRRVDQPKWVVPLLVVTLGLTRGRRLAAPRRIAARRTRARAARAP